MSMRHALAASILLMFFLAARSAGGDGTVDAPLEKRVDSFVLEQGTLFDGLLKLGAEQHVPMAIEYLNADALTKPLTIRIGPATVGQVLGALIQGFDGYSIRAAGRTAVISSTHIPTGRADVLDYLLPEFVVRRGTLMEVNNALCMTADRHLHPGAGGYVGTFPPGKTEKQIGPFKLQSVTVKEVLNRLVSDYQDAAWIGQVPPQGIDAGFARCDAWRIVQYDDPAMERNIEILRRDLHKNLTPENAAR